MPPRERVNGRFKRRSAKRDDGGILVAGARLCILVIDGRPDPVLARWPAGTDWQTLLAGAFDGRPTR
jgi:hypothetical protein